MSVAAAWRSLALDIGSTRLKLGALGRDGALHVLESIDAPPVREAGLICEFDAGELDRRVGELLARGVREAGAAIPIGIASQRSTFVVWHQDSGRALTPAISWRDRRAADWCAVHAADGPWFEALSGLRLSPHYLGPKLAVVLAAAPWRASGSWRVGTLESFLVARRRPPGERARTDASMAARTLLFDPRAHDWSDAALERCGVPRAALPLIVPTDGAPLGLRGGGLLSASISDQASAFLAVVRAGAGDVLVNLGTGGFALRETSSFEPRAGYLCGPLCATGDGAMRFALEGTINAGAAALERIGGASGSVDDGDLEPELYCAPDESGSGAPHWRPERTLTFSRDADSLAPNQQRRAFLEGLAFRVREIVDALDPAFEARVALAGGLSNEKFLASALATLLRRDVVRLDDREATLLGAARLAAGLEPFASPAAQPMPPSPRGAWIAAKYERWRRWYAAN